MRFEDNSKFGKLRHHFHKDSIMEVTRVDVTLCSLNEESADLVFSHVASRFEELKVLNSKFLCSVVSCVRGQGRCPSMLRFYLVEECFSETLETKKAKDQDTLRLWASQIVNTLSYLQENKVMHRNLIPKNIGIHEGNAYVCNFSLYYCLQDFNFQTSLSSFQCCPPESLYFGTPNFPSYKADVWALGLLLFRAEKGLDLFPQNPKQYFQAIQQIPNVVSDFVSFCLQKQRPTPKELKNHPYILSLDLRSLGSADYSFNLRFIFSLQTLKIDQSSSILTVKSDFEEKSSIQRRFHSKQFKIKKTLKVSLNKQEVLQRMMKQPLNVREQSAEYQFHRVQDLVTSLLRMEKVQIHDVPPFLRSHVWMILLKVENSTKFKALDVECRAETIKNDVLERQLDADIHRCHSYHELIASPLGRLKLKRLIYAYLRLHPKKVYWQGFDSVCAVFLSLNFNDLNLVFCLLESFVEKYLGDFLFPQNHKALKSAMDQFLFFLRFLDPELYLYLELKQVTPDLYCIPWILTLFAHVCALEQTLMIWDHLLLNKDSSLGLLICSILMNPVTRSQILKSEFDEVLHLVSDFSEIHSVLERCSEFLLWIPKSLLQHQKLSIEDLKLHKKNIRIIDVNQNNHISSALIVKDVGSLQKILKKDKLITVLRGNQNDFETLLKWGISGVCLFEALDFCSCNPKFCFEKVFKCYE